MVGHKCVDLSSGGVSARRVSYQRGHLVKIYLSASKLNYTFRMNELCKDIFLVDVIKNVIVPKIV